MATRYSKNSTRFMIHLFVPCQAAHPPRPRADSHSRYVPYHLCERNRWNERLGTYGFNRTADTPQTRMYSLVQVPRHRNEMRTVEI